MIELRLRRPEPDDYPGLVGVIDDWMSDRRAHYLLPRVWFEHFAGTSTLAETQDGQLAGFLVGFVSPDHPVDAVIVLAGTNPNLRRRGIARLLHEQFARDVAPRGVARMMEAVWPGDRGAIEFLRAIGFQALHGPGTRPLYGIPAFTDHEWGREDRAVFVRDVQAATARDTGPGATLVRRATPAGRTSDQDRSPAEARSAVDGTDDLRRPDTIQGGSQ